MKKLILAVLATVIAAVTFAQPRVVAHRGFYTTPGSDENTISSLVNAQKLGIYGIEFDVNLTADDELIVAHGPKVGHLDVQKDTYTEIKNIVLENGNKVPTLREWLIEGKKDPKTKLILELKKHKSPEIETKIAERIVALCSELGMLEQMEFTTFSLHACREFVRLAPSNATIYLSSSLDTPIDGEFAQKEGFRGLSYSLYVFMNRPEIIDRMHELGVESTLWIVDNTELVDWAIKHNVTYISSNFPDKIQVYLNSKEAKRQIKKSKKQQRKL
ncbi:MAG TPA: glycerophosphodiester phosphodiesterase family protein [Sphingobacterium sp.]|nr:glycerophosphodiester phosphodiesterase family protein [Sphingobacterium sp.]